MIFLDTETCGLCGPAVLIQYAEGVDGEIHLYDVWNEPISKTLELIEWFMENEICGFNLVFDHFQLCKLYTMFSLIQDKDEHPIDLIDELAVLEEQARDGWCLKPKSALDLMLYARQGPYQATMPRDPIRIKKVPTQLVFQLTEELEKRVTLKPIFFEKRKDKSQSPWQIYDIEDEDGEIVPDFKDIVLKFNPSTALKALATDAFNLPPEQVLRFSSVELDSSYYPNEIGYAPFATAIGKPGKWNRAWPDLIRYHISHWAYHDIARKYAADDVKYLQMLYRHFGSPPFGDNDSILACMVAAVRWRGFRVDLQAARKLREELESQKYMPEDESKDSPGFYDKKLIPTAPEPARWWIREKMGEDEKMVEMIQASTNKVTLKAIAEWKTSEGTEHPAAKRAKLVFQARQCQYEINFIDKILLAGRLHADFKVIGSKSSRMSGDSGLNAQGIKGDKDIRSMFKLAWDGDVLCAGDFSTFEVTLAEAKYNDPDLRKALKSGKKIHGLFGVHVFPPMTYEEILASEKTKNDKYTPSKSAVFLMLYGGTIYAMQKQLGVPEETAKKALEQFFRQFPNIKKSQQEIHDAFQSMKQIGGIGGRIEWRDPAEYIESMFGFRRYFTLENQICKALFDLASNVPKSWQKHKIKVHRRDREQTVSGAVQSALYATAFTLQSSNTRAAINHVIQSSGAQITKDVQRAVWDHQPSGVHSWRVQPMNIHDEILAPCVPELVEPIKKSVMERVESFRPKVPLIKMDWKIGLNNWAEKG